MGYNAIKIAQRKLWNKKWSTFTKLFSLSIGIVSLFFIAIYIKGELGYDTFHSKQEQIFKVNTSVVSPTGDLSLGLSAIPVGPYIKLNSPQVQEYVRINKEYGSHAIKAGDNLFSESENIFYSDPDFFKLFDFDMISGNKASALNGPDKIILTENSARKYFGTRDALDEVLLYDGQPFTVSGIIQNMPANSHLQFDFLISMDTFMKSRPEGDQNWEWFPMNTYLLLERNASSDAILGQLKQVPQYLEKSVTNDQYVLSMEPLKGLHFSSPKLGELGPKGKLANLYVLL
ncbi:MAG: ABC transporter permease, partial [Flavobacteriaceae bacterium]